MAHRLLNVERSSNSRSTALNIMKKTNVFLCTALLACATAANVCAVPSAYMGNTYQVFSAPGITWADAKLAAENAGGYLATATSASENAFIDSLRVAAQLGQVWLGGRQPDGELNAGAGWHWITGEDWNCFVNWGGGEPNDNYGAGSEQHLGIGLFGNDTWNDEGSLGNIDGYVIEWGDRRNCVPEGGSLAFVSLLSIAGLFTVHRRIGRR